MYNVCLGVTKILVKLWVKGKKTVLIVDIKFQEVNNALLKLRDYVPSEFCLRLCDNSSIMVTLCHDVQFEFVNFV